jgi:hypothetical protein
MAAPGRRPSRRAHRTPLPREILSAATFPLRHRPTDCDAFAGSARHDLGPRDAFLTVLERGHDDNSQWSDFPPRPARFNRGVEKKRAEPACGDQEGTSTTGETSRTSDATSTCWWRPAATRR